MARAQPSFRSMKQLRVLPLHPPGWDAGPPAGLLDKRDLVCNASRKDTMM